MTGPILVWGAGAIGGTIGAALARAGEDIVFVDSAGDHVDAINRGGLHITGPLDEHRVAVRALRPGEVTGLFGRIVLAVKAHHTPDALDALAPHLAPDGVVVSAQNGLNETLIAERVGRGRTLGCFVNFGADYLEPGRILYGGRGAVVVGELDGQMSRRLAEWHRLLGLFDAQAIATPNIWGFLWAKQIYGALLFGTALSDDSIADVLADPATRPVLTRLAREVAAAAEAEGVTTQGFDGFDPTAFRLDAPPEAAARSFDDMVAHNRRSVKTHSGIWRDLAVRKRKTEVDAQLGVAIAIGRRHGLPMPVAETVVRMVHEIEDGRRAHSPAALTDLDRATGQARVTARDLRP